jgi:hypothetical protein
MAAKFIKKTGLLFLILCTFAACREKVVQVKVHDLTPALDSLTRKGPVNAGDYARLKKQFGPFFDFYLQEVLGLWTPSDSFTAARIGLFARQNQLPFKMLAASRPLLEKQEEQLGLVFTKWKKELPGDSLPRLYRYYSQLSNYFTFAADLGNGKYGVGYSAEMFLGDTFAGYKALELPRWYSRFCQPDMAAAMVAMSSLHYLYDTFNPKDNMLGEMIYYGKLLYATTRLAGYLKPWQVAAMKENEWEWLKREEASMWKHYLDAQVLFSSNRNDYQRYFVEGDRTTGSGIPNDCPPMIGRWTGLRIVEAWMERKGNPPLETMLSQGDPQAFLNESGYKPK